MFSILLTALLMSLRSTSDARDDERDPISEDALPGERFRLCFECKDFLEDDEDIVAPTKSSILLGTSLTPLKYGFFFAEDFRFLPSKERFSNTETDKLLY